MVETRLGTLDARLESVSRDLASQTAGGEEEASRRESRLAAVELGLARLGTTVEQLTARQAELQTRLHGTLETLQALAQSRAETKSDQRPAPAARVHWRGPKGQSATQRLGR